MKSITNYIDECKEKTGSDYATAKALGIEKSVISSIRRREAIADENAVKVAELLGIDPGEVLLAAVMARSHGNVKAAWSDIAKKAGIAASVLLLTGLASVKDVQSNAVNTGINIHYAKLIMKRLRNCVRAVFHYLESKSWLGQGSRAFTIPAGTKLA